MPGAFTPRGARDDGCAAPLPGRHGLAVSWIAFIRHGPTAWNAEGRIQGRTDVPLSPEGRDEVARWRLPDELSAARCRTSPLGRARETAALLGLHEPRPDAALIEMDWGTWEGAVLGELRVALGEAMAANEQRGLDFQPPGGESPRAVRRRLRRFVAARAASDQPLVAVTHKGVIRAALSLATAWDMRAKPPFKLRWDCAHVFDMQNDGTLLLRRLNVSLVAGGRRRAPRGRSRS